MSTHQDLANFIWSIADLLRGAYRPPQYERVMLPLTVLRRFDCVLAPTKDAVVAAYASQSTKLEGEALDAVLNRQAGQRFHNHSPLTFEKLRGDPENIQHNLRSYVAGFSANVQRIFKEFSFDAEIERMHEHNILYLVVRRFCDVDLHPSRVDNIEMGLLFENLIRRFNEQANETAGDYFTPREVISLMVNLLFVHDDDLLSRPGVIKKLLDPACGTGGMLSEARNHVREHNFAAKLYVYGQDHNDRSYAIAASDLLLKEERGDSYQVELGDSLVDDRFAGQKFDYFLANPPFGSDWKKQQRKIVDEHEKLRFAGRFGAGLPRINDSALLFLQHMVDKFTPVDLKQKKEGSRLAIVFNGSPLFSGGAGSGESEIRKWIVENDWLEAIVALPEQMFYNTGIGTYIWVVTNRKEARREGKVQLIDARECWVPLRRSLGNKRRKLAEPEDGVVLDGGENRDDVSFLARAYGEFADLTLDETRGADGKLLARTFRPTQPGITETWLSKVFDNREFGYNRITVERPLRLRFQITPDRKTTLLDVAPHLLDDVQAIDKLLGREQLLDWNNVHARVTKLLKERESKWRAAEIKGFRNIFTEVDPAAKPVILRGSGKNVEHEADPNLRDFENVPLLQDVDAYFKREVLPHVPDAWVDEEKSKVGYEINFNRYFYRYTPPRELAEIDAELKAVEAEILALLGEVAG